MEQTVVELSQRQRVWLTPQATAPRLARDFLARACAEWHAERFTDVGRLVISELVTNAVLHSGTAIGVELSLEQGRLYLSVHDGGGGIPAPVPPEKPTTRPW